MGLLTVHAKHSDDVSAGSLRMSTSHYRMLVAEYSISRLDIHVTAEQACIAVCVSVLHIVMMAVQE